MEEGTAYRNRRPHCQRDKKMIKKILLGILILTVLSFFSSATLTRSDFDNVIFSNGRGSSTSAAGQPGEHVIYNIGKGWNLVPLKFMMEATSRYWSNYKEGKTCEQDIVQNVWYYSPVQGKYYHIPRMDDWGSPKQRGNSFLLNEFKGKFYHIHGGSAWVYSPNNCILEGDSGIQLITEGSYGSELEPETGYQYKELVLKAGWNFVPVDMRMVAYEKSIKELFEQCNAQRFYKYDKANNKWVDVASEVGAGNKLGVGDIFDTILIKTTKDCNFANYDASSSSSPPSIPN